MSNPISYQRLKVLIRTGWVLRKRRIPCFSRRSGSCNFSHWSHSTLNLKCSSPSYPSEVANIPQSPKSHFEVSKTSYSTYGTFDEQPPSWLFVSDAVAGAYGAQVNLDLDLEKISPPESLIDNFEQRGMSFDNHKLISDYQELRDLRQRRQDLSRTHDNLRKQLEELMKDKNNNSEASLDEIKAEMNKCRSEMKNLMVTLWSVEEKVMTVALRLPNDLHPSTRLKESAVLQEKNTENASSSSSLNHVEIGKKFDLIKFSNVGPQAYYLKGQLAHAARKLSDYACDHFLARKYRLVSGPEFFKSPILESCGRDVFDKQEVLTMQHVSRDVEPMTHLTGVSLMTFAAYVAKLCVGDAQLPLKMFSVGPRYQTVVKPLGLYGAAQSTQVATFCCTTEKDLNSQYEAMVDTLWDFVASFGFPVRMIHCCASALRREERRKVQMEIWAPSLGHHVPIAHVSDLGDFVSRRQMSIHNHNHADIRHTKLLHMVSGTAIDLTTLLATWMEHSDYSTNSGKFVLKELPVF